MFDPQTDPLGIGVQGRARANRFQQAVDGMASPIGPLPDPQWDGYFQAVDEAAGGKKVQFGKSTPAQSDGIAGNPKWWLEGVNKGPLNATAQSVPASIRGLYKGSL